MALAQIPVGYESVAQLLDRLGICRQTLYRWLAAGLPSHQPSGRKGRRLFDPVEVDRWLKVRCTTPTPEQAAS